jgi:hypothetical protein
MGTPLHHSESEELFQPFRPWFSSVVQNIGGGHRDPDVLAAEQIPQNPTVLPKIRTGIIEFCNAKGPVYNLSPA